MEIGYSTYVKIPVRRLTRLSPTQTQAGGRRILNWRCGKALARLWASGIDYTIVGKEPGTGIFAVNSLDDKRRRKP